MAEDAASFKIEIDLMIFGSRLENTVASAITPSITHNGAEVTSCHDHENLYIAKPIKLSFFIYTSCSAYLAL